MSERLIMSDPTPNPQPPLVISEEARASAFDIAEELSLEYDGELWVAQEIQLAINQATEKLTKENSELKADNERMVIVGQEYSKSTEGRIQMLTKEIEEFEALVDHKNHLLYDAEYTIEKLRHRIATDFMSGVVIEKDKKIQTLTIRIKELEAQLSKHRDIPPDYGKDRTAL